MVQETSPVFLAKPDLPELVARFEQLSRRLETCFVAARGRAASDRVSPGGLREILLAFFAGLDAPPPHDPVTAAQHSDRGLKALADLAQWAEILGDANLRAALDEITLTVAGHIVDHGGSLHSVTPVVDALANIANHLRDPAVLAAVAEFIGRILRATPAAGADAEVQAALRLLHLNRGIVATRSHDVRLMTEVFEEIATRFPEDAAGFFREGMEQMERLNYPAPVRDLMGRYFARYSHPTLH